MYQNMCVVTAEIKSVKTIKINLINFVFHISTTTFHKQTIWVTKVASCS